jgi:hypothetical protein
MGLWVFFAPSLDCSVYLYELPVPANQVTTRESSLTYPPSYNAIESDTYHTTYSSPTMALGSENHAPVPHASATTTSTSSATSRTFHPFPRLPAELRADIWALALSNQPTIRPFRHFIHIHQKNDFLYVRLPRNLPTLFFVNREARYEAACIDGGAWHSLGVGRVELYVNFEKNTAFMYRCCDGCEYPGLDKRFLRGACPPGTRPWAHRISYYHRSRHVCN